MKQFYGGILSFFAVCLCLVSCVHEAHALDTPSQAGTEVADGYVPSQVASVSGTFVNLWVADYEPVKVEQNLWKHESVVGYKKPTTDAPKQEVLSGGSLPSVEQFGQVATYADGTCTNGQCADGTCAPMATGGDAVMSSSGVYAAGPLVRLRGRLSESRVVNLLRNMRCRIACRRGRCG